MGATKTHHFTERQNELATLIKALGHPARIAIIDYLLKTESCICGDIVNELPLAQPTVSQHLKELKMQELLRVMLKETPSATVLMMMFGINLKGISTAFSNL